MEYSKVATFCDLRVGCKLGQKLAEGCNCGAKGHVDVVPKMLGEASSTSKTSKHKFTDFIQSNFVGEKYHMG